MNDNVTCKCTYQKIYVTNQTRQGSLSQKNNKMAAKGKTRSTININKKI